MGASGKILIIRPLISSIPTVWIWVIAYIGRWILAFLFSNALIGNILAIQKNLAGSGLLNARYNFRQGGLATAVGPRNDHKFPVVNG